MHKPHFGRDKQSVPSVRRMSRYLHIKDNIQQQINVCNSSNPQSFRWTCPPGLCPGPAGDRMRSPDPSPTHARRMELFFSSFGSFIESVRFDRSCLYTNKSRNCQYMNLLLISKLMSYTQKTSSWSYYCPFGWSFSFRRWLIHWKLWFVLVYRQTKANMLTTFFEQPWCKLFNTWLIDHDILTLQRTIGLVLTHSSFHCTFGVCPFGWF
jgi:hypothetical protein